MTKPQASQEARRIARRLRIVTALTILAVVTAAAWQVGAIRPRLGPGGGSEYGSTPGAIYYGIFVRNVAYLPVTITGAGRSGPGLELTAVEGTFPVTLQRGRDAWILVRYRVTDCAAVTSEAWPIPVFIDRLWGTQTVHVSPPTQSPSQSRVAGLPTVPTARASPVQWQRNQAERACAPDG